MTTKTAIVYSLKRHRKINGTLFYCFEYFLYLRSLGSDVAFVLHNTSQDDLQSLIHIFNQRYVFDHSVLTNIIRLERISDFYKHSFARVLFLDVHSLELLGMFTRAELFCYSNIANGKISYAEKKITYFGYYDYQEFDIKERLKFHFSVYRPLEKSQNGVLVVHPEMDYKNVTLPDNLKSQRVMFKSPSTAIDKLFEQFSTLYYLQGKGLDTNNRLIPESFFYEKEIIIEKSGVIDSVVLRFEDIRANGIEAYQLSKDDLVISHFLS